MANTLPSDVDVTQAVSNNTSQTPPVIPAPATTDSPEYVVDKTAPEDLDMMWTRWKCLVCNYTYEGSKPLKKCPRCGNEDPDKFEDAD